MFVTVKIPPETIAAMNRFAETYRETMGRSIQECALAIITQMTRNHAGYTPPKRRQRKRDQRLIQTP